MPVPRDLNKNFETTLGQTFSQFNHDYFDIQDQKIEGRESSCEESEENEFHEDQYVFDEERSVDGLGWPPEMLHQLPSPKQERRCKKYHRRQILKEDEGADTTCLEVALGYGTTRNNDNGLDQHNMSFYDRTTTSDMEVVAEFQGNSIIHEWANNWEEVAWSETLKEDLEREVRGEFQRLVEEDLEREVGGEFQRVVEGDDIGIPQQIRTRLKNNVFNFDSRSELSVAESEYREGEKEKDGNNGNNGIPESIKLLYCDCNWNQKSTAYDPEPQEFVGDAESNIFWRYFPTFMQFFEIFWPDHILHAIVMETNRYATVENAHGKTIGGPGWKPFTVPEFKVFLATILYMGMKLKPNIKSFWNKQGSNFCYPIIPHLTLLMSFYIIDKIFTCYHSKKLCFKITVVGWLVNAK